MKKSPFYRKLWEFSDVLSKEKNLKDWMNIFECFSGIEYPAPPFDEHLQCYFPVLEGTPHAIWHLLTPEMVQMLGTLSKIPDEHNKYEEKINTLLSIPLSKKLFKGHSLFLLIEHCKLFMVYNKKVKELLLKLEKLE